MERDACFDDLDFDDLGDEENPSSDNETLPSDPPEASTLETFLDLKDAKEWATTLRDSPGLWDCLCTHWAAILSEAHTHIKVSSMRTLRDAIVR